MKNFNSIYKTLRKIKHKHNTQLELASRVILVLILIVFSQTATTETKNPSILGVRKEIERKLEKPHKENIFGVKFKRGVPYGRVQEINSQFSVATTPNPKWLSQRGYVQTVHVNSEEEMKEKMLDYSLNPDVEFVEVAQTGEFTWSDSGTKQYSDDFDQTPTPATGNHWYFDKTNLPEVWDDMNCSGTNGASPCGGSQYVIVAVLDSGLAYQNYNSNYEFNGTGYTTNFGIASELNGINLWSNPDGETEAIHNDADGNSICDDEHGVDFGMYIENSGDDYENCSSLTDIQKEGHPNDDNGHGTFVTGIIASLTNNAASSVGSAHNVSIMPLKISPPFDDPNSYAFYHAVVYAVDYGADVIQVSSGWTFSDTWLEQAVSYAHSNGVLIVASSGNGWGDGIDYPAAYSTTMAIGAVNADNSRSNYSDYGSALDISAPVGEGGGAGDSVYQQSYTCLATTCTSSSNFTTFSNLFGSGTSFAAPQVSAAAALLKSEFVRLTDVDLRNHLKRTATSADVLNLEDATTEPLFVRYGKWISNWGIDSDQYFSGDFDGDTYIDDILQAKKRSDNRLNWYVKTSDGSSFSSSSFWKEAFGRSLSSNRFYIGDFDNDGKSDILNARLNSSHKYNWYVATSTGSSFVFSGNWISNWGIDSDSFYIGDFDGDGFKDDILQAKRRSDYKLNWYVKTSNGSAFSSSSKWEDKFGDSRDTNRFYIGDFNNDGNDDILNARINAINKFNWYVAVSNGSSFSFDGNWILNWGIKSDLYYIGDFDGDNHSDDIVQAKKYNSGILNWYVKTSNGSTFTSSSLWLNKWSSIQSRFLIGNFDDDNSIDDIVDSRENTNLKFNWFTAFVERN